MLLLTFFLFPVVLADVQERTINNYVVKIDGSTLKSIQSSGTSSPVLNLSGLGLQVLENNVFDYLTTVKNLNLGNNLIYSIPNGLFSKLGNLEHLSLANNKILELKKPFEYLVHLKTLNISNNHLESLGGTNLYGLTKSSVIFTKGLPLYTLNAYVFEKEHGSFSTHVFYIPELDDEETTTIGSTENPTNKIKEKGVNSNETQDKNEHTNDSEKLANRKRRSVNNRYYIKICIHDDVLKLVERLKKNETLPSDCQRAELNEYSDLLNLANMSIAKFEKGWYQLDNSIITIRFTENKIVEVTSELINDLPANVRNIDLSRNKIERLNSGIINNSYIRVLELTSNSISEIETNALANMPILQYLFLNKNLLTDTKFAASLSNSVYVMHLERNKITEISPGSFSRLSELVSLYLDGNLIQEVKSNSLHGLIKLEEIYLSNNRISSIDSTSFQQTNLRTIRLSNNSIASFEKGTFDNLDNLWLDVSYNKLSSIKENFPDGLPPNLMQLTLDFNEIKELERDAFKNVPLQYLSLIGNKISKIKRGTFDSRTLRTIFFDKNSLNELDNDSFYGLKHIQKLSLSENGITSIPKGFTKNMRYLYELDLSMNPIKRLQNGALYGFRTSAYNTVLLKGVPVEIIEGGLFDDM